MWRVLQQKQQHRPALQTAPGADFESEDMVDQPSLEDDPRESPRPSSPDPSQSPRPSSQPSTGPGRSVSNPVNIHQEQPRPRSKTTEAGTSPLTIKGQKIRHNEYDKKGMGTNNCYFLTNQTMSEAFKQSTLLLILGIFA